MLMDAEALSGFAMLAKALAFSSQNYLILMKPDVRAAIAKPDKALASISVLIPMNAEVMSGFVPKNPQGL